MAEHVDIRRKRKELSELKVRLYRLYLETDADTWSDNDVEIVYFLAKDSAIREKLTKAQS